MRKIGAAVFQDLNGVLYPWQIASGPVDCVGPASIPDKGTAAEGVLTIRVPTNQDMRDASSTRHGTPLPAWKLTDSDYTFSHFFLE